LDVLHQRQAYQRHHYMTESLLNYGIALCAHNYVILHKQLSGNEGISIAVDSWDTFGDRTYGGLLTIYIERPLAPVGESALKAHDVEDKPVFGSFCLKATLSKSNKDVYAITCKLTNQGLPASSGAQAQLSLSVHEWQTRQT